MNTKLRKSLRNLTKAIVEEAERNPQFEQQLKEALGLNDDQRKAGRTSRPRSGPKVKPGGRRHRRTPAVLDPIKLAQVSEQTLRERLISLSIEQLKDIVAEYGMDPSKLVMKWKSHDNIVNRIVEISIVRAQKGDAFRS